MNEDILKILIPIITFILGTIISIFNLKHQRKLSNRCYPNVVEVHLPFTLDKSDFDAGMKMYYDGEYAEIYNTGAVDKTAKIIYLKVTNFGPGHMMNCNFDIVISSTDFNEEWNTNLYVKLIKKDEIILIPSVKEDMLQKEIILKSVTINYLTTSGEKMRYSFILNTIQGNITFIEESLQIIKFKLFKEKVYKYKGKSSLFVFVNLKKDN